MMGTYIPLTFIAADLRTLPADVARVGALVLARAARRGMCDGCVFLPYAAIAAATGLRLRCQIDRAIDRLVWLTARTPCEGAMAARAA